MYLAANNCWRERNVDVRTISVFCNIHGSTTDLEKCTKYLNLGKGGRLSEALSRRIQNMSIVLVVCPFQGGCGSGFEPMSCFWKAAGLILLFCMSKCPLAGN